MNRLRIDIPAHQLPKEQLSVKTRKGGGIAIVSDAALARTIFFTVNDKAIGYLCVNYKGETTWHRPGVDGRCSPPVLTLHTPALAGAGKVRLRRGMEA